MTPNPYTCRTLRRIDGLIWRLRGKRVYWSSCGHFSERHAAGHGSELPTHFPDSWFIWANKVQNKYIWTRKILSL